MVASAPRVANEAHLLFKADAYAADDLEVAKLKLVESISTDFQCDLLLVGRAGFEADVRKIVGSMATITITGDDTPARTLHGLVHRMYVIGGAASEGRVRYRAQMAPRLWKLRHVQLSRIFQKQSVVDIVKHILGEHGVKARWAVSGSYSKLDYVVQYRETDFDFVSRRLEENGIFYFFEHDDHGEHVMVLADSSSEHKPIAGKSTVVFRDRSGLASTEEAVYELHWAREMRSGAVTLRDFNFHKPALDLTAAANDGDAEEPLEIYDYPGIYDDPSAGKALATTRLEELRCQAERGEGESNCRRLVPGSTFDIDRDGDVKSYLIIAVDHLANQPQAFGQALEGEAQAPDYRNRFVCIPAKVPFRPERKTPIPVVYGPQTATVSGPSGEEIFVDDQGRVKVQFHWDREGKNDDKTSCWIRVTQAWAGGGWGALFTPRIGQEVVIEFLEGDPDRPLITGSVYNGTHPPPVALPDKKTQSTIKSNSSPNASGFNELMFDDLAGSEMVSLHAQKDMSIAIEHDKTQSVGHDEKLSVGNDRNRQVSGNQTLEVTKNDGSQIGGNQTLGVGGDRTTSVGGNHTETIGGSQSSHVSGTQSITVALAATESIAIGKMLDVGGGYAINVGGAMNEAIGGLKAEMVGGAKVELVGARKSEKVGGARKLKVGKNLTETCGGKRSVKVGKDASFTVGGAYSQAVGKTYAFSGKEVAFAAEEECTISVGSVAIQLKKDGSTVIKASKVEITASGDVIIKGAKIEEN